MNAFLIYLCPGRRESSGPPALQEQRKERSPQTRNEGLQVLQLQNGQQTGHGPALGVPAHGQLYVQMQLLRVRDQRPADYFVPHGGRTHGEGPVRAGPGLLPVPTVSLRRQ